MNALKTTILLALLTGILVAAGQALGGREGAWLALVFAAVLNFGSYWFSDKIVLSMYKAVPVDQVNDPQARRLQTIVERLVVKAGLPMPKMYLIPDASLNAFATGRDPSHAAVAATAGILQALDDQELEGTGRGKRQAERSCAVLRCERRAPGEVAEGRRRPTGRSRAPRWLPPPPSHPAAS